MPVLGLEELLIFPEMACTAPHAATHEVWGEWGPSLSESDAKTKALCRTEAAFNMQAGASPRSRVFSPSPGSGGRGVVVQERKVVWK
ncbi:UNVERIFIED_CONTAM: hypothetical protein K2H54_017123 [Gekko kuhli]